MTTFDYDGTKLNKFVQKIAEGGNLGKVDIASRFISMILTSQAASRVAKDRAMLLKEEIIAKLHGKG